MNSLGTYEDISVALPFFVPVHDNLGSREVWRPNRSKDALSSIIFAVCNALFLAQREEERGEGF